MTDMGTAPALPRHDMLVARAALALLVVGGGA